MPKVGSGKAAKKFPYTFPGIAAAKDEAKKSGKPLEMTDSKKPASKKKKPAKKPY